MKIYSTLLMFLFVAAFACSYVNCAEKNKKLSTAIKMLDAIKKNKVSEVEQLFNDGFNPTSALDKNGNTAMHYAVKALLKFIIDKGVVDSNDKKLTSSPLYQTFERINDFCFEKPGCSVKKNKAGETPLMVAIPDIKPSKIKKLDSTVVLLEFIADSEEEMQAKDPKGRTASDIAKERGFPNIVKYLKELADAFKNPGKDEDYDVKEEGEEVIDIDSLKKQIKDEMLKEMQNATTASAV